MSNLRKFSVSWPGNTCLPRRPRCLPINLSPSYRALPGYGSA